MTRNATLREDGPGAPAAGWLLIVVSLSGEQGTLRMRLWRALKAFGAAVLRDGVYLLPALPPLRENLRRTLAEAGVSDAVALLTELPGQGAEQDAAFAALFDRGDAYADLLSALRGFLDRVKNLPEPEARRELRQLNRSFESIRSTDYFPGRQRADAEKALQRAHSAYSRRFSPGEPEAVHAPIPKRDVKIYQGRLWATRRRPWVDRLASAWLIRRFIDRRARFVWLKQPRDCPREAVGFDFDGAEFTHVEENVTFEVLLTSFGLETDAVLQRLAAMVHYLDVGGVPAPEAQGLEKLLAGLKRSEPDDDKFLQQACRIFDWLYAGLEAEATAAG